MMTTEMAMMGEDGRGWEIDQFSACGLVCARDWVNNSPSGRGSSILARSGARMRAGPEKTRSSSYPLQ